MSKENWFCHFKDVGAKVTEVVTRIVFIFLPYSFLKTEW